MKPIKEYKHTLNLIRQIVSTNEDIKNQLTFSLESLDKLIDESSKIEDILDYVLKKYVFDKHYCNGHFCFGHEPLNREDVCIDCFKDAYLERILKNGKLS